MDVLTVLIISTGALLVLLIVLSLLLVLSPTPQPVSNNRSIQEIKQQVEDEVVSETAPYKMPKNVRRMRNSV